LQCPIDGTLLAISERQGIEIDYCPQCRGVWLDRGELDKLLDRADDVERGRGDRDDDRDRGHDRDRDRDRDRGYDRPREYGHGGHKKKRKSFLGELFEFD